LQDRTMIAVTAGLKEGDLVVINPAGFVPGEKIRPEVREAAGGD
jgi:hypothetical protein